MTRPSSPRDPRRAQLEALVARVVLCTFEGDEARTRAVTGECITSPRTAAAVIGELAFQQALLMTFVAGKDARMILEKVVTTAMEGSP